MGTVLVLDEQSRREQISCGPLGGQAYIIVRKLRNTHTHTEKSTSIVLNTRIETSVQTEKTMRSRSLDRVGKGRLL